MLLCDLFWLLTLWLSSVVTSVRLSVCLSVFPHDISKTDAPSIIKLDIKCSTTNSENPFIWSQKVKGQGRESQKHCQRGSLHSCECWLLLVAAVVSLPTSLILIDSYLKMNWYRRENQNLNRLYISISLSLTIADSVFSIWRFRTLDWLV